MPPLPSQIYVWKSTSSNLPLAQAQLLGLFVKDANDSNPEQNHCGSGPKSIFVDPDPTWNLPVKSESGGINLKKDRSCFKS